MKKLIKGMPDWIVPLNDNFTEIEKDKTNILNKIDGVNTQLSDIEQQVVSIPSQEYIADKAKIVDVNSAFASRDVQIASLASGSPKGAYTTLTELQTAFPTGTSGTYVVAPSLYFWNGTTWTVLIADYQSSVIVDGTINNNKLNLPVKDLLPITYPFILNAVDTSTGEVKTSNARCISSLIRVYAGTKISIIDKINTHYALAYYNVTDQTFNKYVTFTTEETVFTSDWYIRVMQKYSIDYTTPITDLNLFGNNVYITSDKTAIPKSDVITMLNKGLSLKANAVEVINKTDKNIITPEMTTFVKSGKNKFNGIFITGESLHGNYPNWTFTNTLYANAKSILFKAEKLKTYTISKADGTNRFGIATFIGRPINNQVVARAINNATNIDSPKTLTLIGDEDYILITLSSDSEGLTPEWVQIEEGTIATSFSNYDNVVLNIEVDSLANIENDIFEIQQNLLSMSKQKIMYVSPTGTDVNDGLTSSSPLATFQKAIDSGASTVLAVAGDYIGQTINASNLKNLEIKALSTSNNSNTNERKTARLVNATDISLTLDDTLGVYKSALSLPNTSNWYKVFIDNSLIVEEKSYYTNPTMMSYNAILWEVNNQIKTNLDEVANDKKLIPKLTLAECQSNQGTFFYDGSYVYINPTDGLIINKSYKRLINETGDLAYFHDINKLNLIDIDFMYGAGANLQANNIDEMSYQHCTFGYSAYKTGLRISNTNGEFTKCYAYKNRTDGFAPMGNGDTHFYDCEGLYNYDDGISHHDKCTGSINGGEYHHNYKGGVAPAHGAKVDVYNVISHDNGYGFYCQADADTLIGRKVNHVGCVAYGNNIGISAKNYNVLSYNCKYTNNTTQTNVTSNSDTSLTIL